MTDQMTHAEEVGVIAEKVEEIERLQTELAELRKEHKELFDGNHALMLENRELRKAQGEPAAWVSILGAYAHIQWGSRADDNIHTVPLYTSAPTIPEGYVLVHESVLEAANHAAECVVLENMHRPGFTFGRLVKLAEAIAAAPKPTKDAA